MIPALIRKMIESPGEVVLWGDGTPTREFLFVDDCVEGLALAAERYDGDEPVNLGTGVETSIRELAETIGDVTGFEGRDRLGYLDAERPAPPAARRLPRRGAVRLSRADVPARGDRAHRRLVSRRGSRACRSLTGSGPREHAAARSSVRRSCSSGSRRSSLRCGPTTPAGATSRARLRSPPSRARSTSSTETCLSGGRASCGRSSSLPLRAWPTRSTACWRAPCCSTCSSWLRWPSSPPTGSRRGSAGACSASRPSPSGSRRHGSCTCSRSRSTTPSSATACCRSSSG